MFLVATAIVMSLVTIWLAIWADGCITKEEYLKGFGLLLVAIASNTYWILGHAA